MQSPEETVRTPRISAGMQSPFYLVILGAIVACAAIWLAIGHRAAAGARRELISEQTGLVRLAAGAFEDRLYMPISQAGIMARHDLGDFFQGQGAIGMVVDHLQAGLGSYPDVTSYTLVDTSGELVYAQGVESEAGDKAVNRSLAWAKQFHFETAMPPEDKFVTASTSSASPASIDALFPVYLRDVIVGALIVTIDVQSVAGHVFKPADAGASSDLCLLDSQGLTIYQAGKQGCGASLRRIGREDFQDLLSRARETQTGSAIYAQSAGALGFLRPRVLVCWQGVKVGSRMFIVCRTKLMRRCYK